MPIPTVDQVAAAIGDPSWGREPAQDTVERTQGRHAGITPSERYLGRAVCRRDDRIAELEAELEGARIIIAAREARLAQVEAALKQRDAHLRIASDAAESYRLEARELRGRLAAIVEILER